MSNKCAHTGQLSRADLLRALLSGDAKQVVCIAEQLGLHYVPDSPPVTIGGNDAVKPPEIADSNIQQHLVVEDGLRPTVGFWFLASRESHALSDQQTEPVAVPVTVEWDGRPQQAPRYHLLTTQRDFIPRLLPWLQNVMAGFKPDINKLVERVSRGEPLHDVPRLPLKPLGGVVQVIDDRHTHLIPYWQDHSALRRWVRALHHDTLEQAVLMEGQAMPRSLTASGWQVWQPPTQHGVVVILSDLGALSLNPHGQVASWLAIGQMLERAGCQAVVFLPCDPGLCDVRLKTLFRLETFTDSHLITPLPSGAERQRQVSLLLDAVSPVIRLEPGLLRQMRLAMAPHGQQWQMDAAVESLVWQHGNIQERHSVAASWNRDARKQRLQRFAQLSQEEQRTALDVILQWRQPLPKQIWFEEITSLDAVSRNLLAADVQEADAYFQQLSKQVQSDAFLQSEMETREWLQRMLWRLPETVLESATVGKALQRIKFRVSPETSGVDPRNLLASDASEKKVMLYQQGEHISLNWPVPYFHNMAVGSPLGMIRLRHELVRIEVDDKSLGELPLWSMNLDFPVEARGFKAISDLETLYFEQCIRPEWASRFGRNRDDGIFAETESKEGQVYRWVWYPAIISDDEKESKRGFWGPRVEVITPDASKVKIFISYQRGDSKTAKYIHQHLKSLGFDVFADFDLQPGDPIIEQLSMKLEQADMMFILCSKQSLQSEYVQRELEFALSVNMSIFPILMEGVELPDGLFGVRPLDFRKKINPQLLYTAIQSHIGVSLKLPDEYGLEDHYCPEWAGNSGRDQYGLYADLNLKGDIQRFRWIEPGTFFMGSPESEQGHYDDEEQHEVNMHYGFWLADTTVTQAQWQAVMGTNPSHFKDNLNNPVEEVSWNDTQDFIMKLNQLIPALQVRLPTEVEWEYACRAGTITPFSFGENISLEQVNYGGGQARSETTKDAQMKTVTVKSLPANAWGLYEMHGNVWEWCQDLWNDTWKVEWGKSPSSKHDRSSRGGSWEDYAEFCRSAFRREDGDPDVSSDDTGFRIAINHNAFNDSYSYMELSKLKRKVSICDKCAISKQRIQTVFGSGNAKAGGWMFIGEAPGASEDKYGEPFVGKAGDLLNNMLINIGINRGEVYIANVLKCRPPNNRDPMPEEVLNCKSYLDRQVELVNPGVIVLLGRIAAQQVLQTSEPLARLRNRKHRDPISGKPVIVTYHPAYLLRQPADEHKALQDLQLAQKILSDL